MDVLTSLPGKEWDGVSVAKFEQHLTRHMGVVNKSRGNVWKSQHKIRAKPWELCTAILCVIIQFVIIDVSY